MKVVCTGTVVRRERQGTFVFVYIHTCYCFPFQNDINVMDFVSWTNK